MKRIIHTSPVLPYVNFAGIEDLIINFSPDIEDEYINVEHKEAPFHSIELEEDIIIDEVVASIGSDNEPEDIIVEDVIAAHLNEIVIDDELM